jgi:hypothetical protein
MTYGFQNANETSGREARSPSFPHSSACSCSNKNFLQEHAEGDHWRDVSAEHGLWGSGLNVEC